MREAVTQSDVAKAAGVSRGLVSLALSDSPRVADETKKRILSVAEDMGYSRNFGAAALASSRSSLIGMVLPNLRNPYFESLVAAFQTECEARGLTVLTATASGDERREIAMLEQFHAMRVGGIVLATPSNPASHYASFASRIPLIIVGSPYDDGPAHVVHVDEFEAARLVLAHATSRGYSRIAYMTQQDDDEATAYRRAAIEAACADASQELTSFGPDEATQVIASGGRERGSLCLIAHNDYLAIDLISAIRTADLSPGVDVGVISYDNTFLAQHSGFGLTSVDQQPDRQARLALDVIEAPVDDAGRRGSEHVVPPILVPRVSA